MSQIEHPYYPNGTPFPHWNYAKRYAPSESGKFAPIATPEPFECGEYVPSAAEIEKMRKAEEKRARKAARK